MTVANGKLLCDATTGKLLCSPDTGKLLYGISGTPSHTGLIVTATSFPADPNLAIGIIWTGLPGTPITVYLAPVFVFPFFNLNIINAGVPTQCQGNLGFEMTHAYPNSGHRLVGPVDNSPDGIYQEYDTSTCTLTGNTVTFALDYT